jgi:hypothetical protein
MKGFIISYIKTLLYLAVLLGLATAAATITGIINPYNIISKLVKILEPGLGAGWNYEYACA